MWLCAGLLTATVASRIHRAAQPALLYLVPFTLLPLLTMAYLKVLSLSSQTEGGKSSVLTCLLFPGRPAAYVVRTFPHQVQQLSLSGGMMHPWDSRTSVGRTADLFPFRRGKERGRAHSEAVSSSLVHAFPPVKTLRKDTGVWIPTLPTRLIFGLRTSPLPLHYPTSCLCCPPPPPPLPFFPFPLSCC